MQKGGAAAQQFSTRRAHLDLRSHLVGRESESLAPFVALLCHKPKPATLEGAPYDLGVVDNYIGRDTLRLAEPVAADDYSHLRRTGSFLLVDDQEGSTLAAGMAVVARCTEG